MQKRIVWSIAVAAMVGFATYAQTFTGTKGHVCDVDFLATKAGDPGWVVLDGRDGAAYAAGHIPGAVNYGKAVVTVLKHPGDGRVVSVKEAEKLFGQIGLDNKKGLIIYGTKGDYEVTAEQLPIRMGVKQYFYLDGGYEAWVKIGKHVQTEAVKPVPTVFKADAAKMDNRLYVSTKEMIAIAKKQSKNVTLIDTRSPAEFNALDNSTLRVGRIPGAINVPYAMNLDKDTKKMLSLEELALVYKDIPKDNTVILYCRRGCRTTYSFFALEWLGYKKIRIYEDSWVVWGARTDTPVENEHYINMGPIVSDVNKIPALKARLDALEERLKKLEAK
jgi:thiosulfate/3-mercaptopyruvate sulfurtransferase